MPATTTTRPEVPTQVRHCVRRLVLSGKKLPQAFAICVAAAQKRGDLAKGSLALTKSGKARDRVHKKDPEAVAKKAEYETMLAAARTKSPSSPPETNESLYSSYASRPYSTLPLLLREELSRREKAGLPPKEAYESALYTLRRRGLLAEGWLGLSPAGLSAERALTATPAPSTHSATPDVSESLEDIRSLLCERRALPVGTVRSWKRKGGKVPFVKIGAGHWVMKKRRHSTEDTIIGDEQDALIEQQLARRESQKNRLTSRLVYESLFKKIATKLSGKASPTSKEKDDLSLRRELALHHGTEGDRHEKSQNWEKAFGHHRISAEQHEKVADMAASRQDSKLEAEHRERAKHHRVRERVAEKMVRAGYARYGQTGRKERTG